MHLSPIKNRAPYLRFQYYKLGLLFSLLLSFNKIAKTENAPLVSIITLSNLDTEGCCFQLSYNYDGALGNINALETRILTPNVLFSSVQFSLASGWTYNELQAQRWLRWEHNNDNILLGQQTLSDFCFSGWNTSNPVELLVIWRQGNVVRQRDTIRIECSECWQAQNRLVECQEDSSYTYTFDYVNLSEFSIDFLQIREAVGQDLVIEQSISLAQSILPGETLEGVELNFRQGAVDLEKVCFEMTPRHFLNDTIAIKCCTAEYCVPIPICDRCCTDYLIFEEDVQMGFRTEVDCDDMSVRLQANGLNECDRVRFDISGLGAGVVRGDEAVVFGGLNEDLNYDVCMTVIRQDINSQSCYEEASLEYCDQFLFDCDSCINPQLVDYSDVCQSVFDFVCGCDGMTYLNSCAAGSWGGLIEWTDACCGMIGSITLSFGQNPMGNIVLDWTTASTVELRYFLIERRSVFSDTWFNIGEVDNTTFSFTDTNPLNPTAEYRIIGVTLEGKVLLSEDCQVVSIHEINRIEGGKLYPNPVNQELYIELPISEQQYFEISNSTGQRIYQSTTNYQGKATISTQQWPAGYYFITAYIDHKTLWRKPFIIQH